MNLVERVYRRFDKWWSKAVAQNGLKITCSNGCFWCCKEAAYCTRFEAVETLRHISPENMPGVIERTREWVQKFKLSGMAVQQEPHVTQYRAANLWCPLLKDNKCMVYSHRPMACRGHCAVKPAVLCQNDSTRLEQVFVQSPQVLNHASMLFYEEQHCVEFNHLGCFLSELLLGEKIETAARFEVNVPQHHY